MTISSGSGRTKGRMFQKNGKNATENIIYDDRLEKSSFSVTNQVLKVHKFF